MNLVEGLDCHLRLSTNQSTDPDQPSYIELEVNPLGAMLDMYLLGVRKPLRYESWNSEKLRWAVLVDGTVDGNAGDREWTCEVALPMEDIVTDRTVRRGLEIAGE